MVFMPDSTALIKRRVLYIGSAVPLDTAAGLDAVQKPLLERYPVDNEAAIEGIDTNLTVTNNEIAMQYIDSNEQMVIQFPISSLTMCAAVRCVNTVNAASGENVPRFVSLNNPAAGGVNSKRPAIFTMITRRTQGRRVLECHGFICSSKADAMELVKWTQHAGENFKRNNQNANDVTQTPRQTAVPFQATDMNQTSTMPRSVISNGIHNGIDSQPSMRLIPGEPIQNQIKAGPEFFEPVSKQGYFYSSNQAEVKKYNVHKVHTENEDKENIEIRTEEPPPPSREPTVIRVGGVVPAPSPPPQFAGGPPPPMVHYVPAPPPHMARPMYYGPPPPPPPHSQFIMRPRFFSPPPPRVRPMPFMMSGPPPPPRMAAPIYVRRPRSVSGSGSRSSSRGSRSKSPPRQTEETVPKVPNGDADTSSDDTVTLRQTGRPGTPPTDYGKKSGHHGGRMSRREQYDYHARPEPIHLPYRDDVPQPFRYDYYVYPPRHGGYEPFSMYNPHARSRSVPPRGRSGSPHKKGKKKHKKLKKKSKHSKHSSRPVQPQPDPSYGYNRYGFSPRSDISTDSHAGYHSEIPARTTRPISGDVDGSGYQFYPPRDFRRKENQFMNERNFSKSIIAESRRSRDSRTYDARPSAYDLNDHMAKNAAKNEDPDFTMY